MVDATVVGHNRREQMDRLRALFRMGTLPTPTTTSEVSGNP
jgi:hypothetical protein